MSILSIEVNKFTLDAKINIFLLLLLVIALVAGLLWSKKIYRLHRQDVELEIALGGIGKLKIKPNYEVKQIAHKAWVELKTRKAGLPIDKDNDVISDIYRSWYMLFGEIRMLAREVPAVQLKDKDTAKLVDLLIDSLNEGLRPHLTRWRAKYSRWYDKAVARDENDELTPQDIQRKYPEYQDLVDDMLKINKQLVQYTAEIKKLANS